jgi:hypothetical protein
VFWAKKETSSQPSEVLVALRLADAKTSQSVCGLRSLFVSGLRKKEFILSSFLVFSLFGDDSQQLMFFFCPVQNNFLVAQRS